MNIIVYTRPEVVLEKLGYYPDLEDMDWQCKQYVWSLGNNAPKDLNIHRIYFATKGFVLGYFVVDDTELGVPTGTDITFTSSSWKQLKWPKKIKAFQGFKYTDDCSELKDA